MFRELLSILNDAHEDYGKVPKFESIQALLEQFYETHQKTFKFDELRSMNEHDKNKIFSFIFEVLQEEKMAEFEILQEENKEEKNAQKFKHTGFWGIFDKPTKSEAIEAEDDSYQHPELFANLTALKLICLKVLRLLSRDSDIYSNNQILNEENLMILVRLIRTDPIALDRVIRDENTDPSPCKYNQAQQILAPNTQVEIPDEEKLQILEAQKCLCNFVFHNANARNIVASSLAPQIILNRNSERFWKISENAELVFFDLRLLFLLTALSPELRSRLMGFGDDSFKDVTINHLVSILVFFSNQVLQNNTDLDSANINGANSDPMSFSNINLDIINETLKILFNVTMALKKKMHTSHQNKTQELLATPDQPKQISTLTQTCRKLIGDLAASNYLTGDKRWDLDSNVINLLTNVPSSNYIHLIPTVNNPSINDEHIFKLKSPKTNKTTPVEGSVPNGKHDSIDGVYDMTVLDEFLKFLDFKLKTLFSENKENTQSFSENLPIKSDDKYMNVIDSVVPCILLLSETAKTVRPIRKYLKQRILPKLTEQDVKALPEQGQNLRNNLVKLMTSPYLHLKELSADLLFTLCKENVNRMVKYTGYGNAAGILARLGLLSGGGQGPGANEYSSDSSSENDENYNALKNNINPITGKWESDEEWKRKANFLANLTDEEKEQRAEEIAKLLRDLKSTGVIQPIAIGKDGKPIPFDDMIDPMP